MSKFVVDRQTHKFFDTIYGCVDFFFNLNLLPPYSLLSQGYKKMTVDITPCDPHSAEPYSDISNNILQGNSESKNNEVYLVIH